MRAAVWHGRRDVRVETVPDPTITEPTDAIIRVTSSGLCGSDLHLYEVMAPFMTPGDILGHEPMGIVEAVGSGGHQPRRRRPGRRPVQHRVRPLLHVRPGPAVAVRDDAGPRARLRCGAVRLHQAVRPGARRPGRAAARAARRLRPDQGARRSAGRPLPVPVRRACRPPGRASSTPACPPAAASSCSVSDRSVTWPAVSPSTSASSNVIGIDLVPERLERASARRRRARSRRLRRRRRPRRRGPHPYRRARSGRRHRRRRHGGARLAGGEGRPRRPRAPAERAGREADEEGRRRPARRAAPGDRARPARRHHLRSSASTAA